MIMIMNVIFHNQHPIQDKIVHGRYEKQPIKIEFCKNYNMDNNAFASGTYGTCYKDKKTCIKKYKNKNSEDSMREICILKELDHTNIIKIIYVNYPDSFTMKLYDGTIKSLIEKPIWLNEPVRYIDAFITDISSALNYLRSKNVMHRDISPDNILYEETSGPVNIYILADFGISRFGCKGMAYTCGAQRIDIRAPEVVYNRDYDINIDLWSFGIIILFGFCKYININNDQYIWHYKCCQMLDLDMGFTPEKYCEKLTIPQPYDDYIRSLCVLEPLDRKLPFSYNKDTKTQIKKDIEPEAPIDVIDYMENIQKKYKYNVITKDTAIHAYRRLHSHLNEFNNKYDLYDTLMYISSLLYEPYVIGTYKDKIMKTVLDILDYKIYCFDRLTLQE